MMLRRNSAFTLGAAVAALLATQAAPTVAWAQAQLPSGVLPSQRQLEAPTFRKPPAETLKLPKPTPPAEGALPSAIHITVSKFQITGNTVFTDAELAEIAAPYENRQISSTELEDLRQRLTKHYIDAGYINSGAVIPDQKVANGIVQIRIIEGRLTQTEIEGTEHFKKSYFTDRIELHAGPPLNIRNLESELQILLRDPMVKSMKAQLEPGQQPGEAVLKAQVEEAPRVDMSLVVDNKLAPALGEVRGTLLGSVNNLIGVGDQLSGEFGYADGIPYNFKASYRTPINAQDTSIGVHYENVKAKVVESPFDQLDIQSRLETIGADISHPIYRTPDEVLNLGAIVERRKTKSSLLGVPFSFSPGVNNGEATVSVARLVGDYVNRGRTQVIAARGTLSVGLHAFGSTINSGGEPDSSFTSFLGQFQWVRRLSERGDTLHLRADFQYTNDGLLPVEQYAVGGLDSVRGYRAFQLLRDKGYTASIEYRAPLLSDPTGVRNLQIAAYVDAGGAKFNNRDNPGPSDLVGIGTGLIWNPSREFSAELYYAYGFNAVPKPSSHSIQDDSLYFRAIFHPSWFN